MTSDPIYARLPDTVHAQARKAVCDYLLSDAYRPYLIRGLFARLTLTSARAAEHRQALDLLEAAFPGEVFGKHLRQPSSIAGRVVTDTT